MENIENYPSWLVPAGIAKSLKKIGFNQSCEFCLPLDVYDDFNTRTLRFDSDKQNYNDCLGYLSIPTYEQAFDWFRSKGIVSWIEHNGERDEYYIKVTVDRFIRLMKCPKGYTDYNCAKKDLLNLLIKIYCEEKITKTNE